MAMLSKVAPLLFAALVALPLPISAQGRPPVQNPVRSSMLSFAEIKARADRAVPGGRMIGSDFDDRNFVYQLRYERGREIIDVLIDARSGRVIGGRENM